MSTSELEWMLALVVAYIGAPLALVWGWVRWTASRPKMWTPAAMLSFIGFGLASVSAGLALLTIGFASLGGFESRYPLFYRAVGIGVVLSLAGILFAVGGVWRKSALRWFAPSSAIGTLAFWLIATTWP